MLSRASHAGRICLSCRYQLRIARPRPLPVTRLAQIQLPRYTTSTNSGTDAKPKTPTSQTDEPADPAREDAPAPEPAASESTADATPSPKAKPTEPSPAEAEQVLAEIEAAMASAAESEAEWTRFSEINKPKPPPTPKTTPEGARPARNRPRRPRSRNGMEVETASLGMNILGEEGHTIVLRDRARRRKEPAALEEDDSLLKNLNLEGSLEEQNRDVTHEETRRNIDELRPADSRDLLAREFDKIQSTLMDGFTSSQLEDYVYHFMAGEDGGNRANTEAHKKELLRRLTGQMRAQLRHPVRPRYGWIREQLSWNPPKNYHWGNTMKEKLALAIMRACWHLQTMEETPYVGDVQLTVDRQILYLLLVEQKSLRAMQSSLGSGADIKVDAKHGKMQIIASRSRCDTVLDQLDRFVSRIGEASIPLSAFGPKPLPHGILGQLSSLTGAHITYNGFKGSSPPLHLRGKKAPDRPRQKDSDAVRIAWLKSANRPETVESLAHVIFRLLLSANNPGNTKEGVKTVYDKDGEINTEGLVMVRQHGDNHELPWNLRDQPWWRLACPAQPKPSQGKHDGAAQSKGEGETVETSEGSPAVPEPEAKEYGEAEPSTTVDSTSDTPPTEEQKAPEASSEAPEMQSAEDTKEARSISPTALRLLLTASPDAPRIEGFWPPTVRTSAVFGHVLNPALDDGQVTAAHKPRAVRADKDSRDSAGIKAAKPDTVALKPVVPPVAALTRLAESTDAPTNTTLIMRLWPKQGRTAPTLEFHLEVPEQDGPLEWETTPKRLLAVRYSSAAHIRLPAHSVDVSIRQALILEMEPAALDSSAALRAFFDASELDLSRDLLTPPSLTMPMPAGLMEREGDAPQEVEYVFVGLELHTSSTVPFRSGSLSLTSVEAGQQGRRTELALHPSGDIPYADARDRGKAYLDEVLRVAKGSYFPWVGSRPLDASSIDDS